MKATLVSIAIVLSINAGDLFGQVPNPSPSSQQTKANWTRLDPYGFVDLPDEFKITDRGGSVDWWYGNIKSADGKFVIHFAAGMAGSVFEKNKKYIVWTKEDHTGSLPITTALMRKNKAESLLAKVGWIQFSAPVANDEEKELFMEIVRSYRKTPNKP